MTFCREGEKKTCIINGQRSDPPLYYKRDSAKPTENVPAELWLAAVLRARHTASGFDDSRSPMGLVHVTVVDTSPNP